MSKETRFTPQTKRFSLVPVEPGKEKDSDLLIEQVDEGSLCLKCFENCDGGFVLYIERFPEAIAALGFPTEGEEA